MQSIPYMVQSAMGEKVSLLAPVVKWSRPATKLDPVFLALGQSLGHSQEKTAKAIAEGRKAQKTFDIGSVAVAKRCWQTSR